MGAMRDELLERIRRGEGGRFEADALAEMFEALGQRLERAQEEVVGWHDWYDDYQEVLGLLPPDEAREWYEEAQT